ncbi:helix-turn-helix transcriptional regulator [Clostridium sp. D33t1_170424_F3]|uniref:helix-turn-helix transcriptional regulator n=1 Tax=Clostridium sp. D33t1_170424_F3 TaxID=2787099 RepID=UPI0018A996B5|nr:helix-turn-helix transcriptional regulator [Clostridium sp. D33t1_170424_F3]
MDDGALRTMGQRLRKYRLQAELTQKQVSEILDIDEQYYGQAERGAKKLSLEKLVAFCSCFHITLDDIIKVNTTAEDRSLKSARIMEITCLLENCSSDQLALIQSLVRNIDILKMG